jgi:hypothetical protein
VPQACELPDEPLTTLEADILLLYSTSVIVSAFEFPDRLEEDQHTLPPYRLPSVDIIEQSARSGMAPSKRTVSFDTMTKGRIWVFRPVPWDYLGFQAEPRAEWPPPEPTRSV